MVEESADKKEKRDKFLMIRISKQEQEKLQELKTEKELATWARQTLLNQPKPIKKSITVDPELLKQLYRIGVNLNQLTRHINTLYDDKDKACSLYYLHHIESHLKELLECVRNGELGGQNAG